MNLNNRRKNEVSIRTNVSTADEILSQLLTLEIDDMGFSLIIPSPPSPKPPLPASPPPKPPLPASPPPKQIHPILLSQLPGRFCLGGGDAGNGGLGGGDAGNGGLGGGGDGVILNALQVINGENFALFLIGGNGDNGIGWICFLVNWIHEMRTLLKPFISMIPGLRWVKLVYNYTLAQKNVKEGSSSIEEQLHSLPGRRDIFQLLAPGTENEMALEIDENGVFTVTIKSEQ
ncbi:hypothetical protein QVD17_31117 [Tagetes erecta]|uniref:Uncharacterized protein n=1 Tax=Tagetes erecta TaxID=13708 RepID=A0AAD8NNK7_TARER|nr:hypothetical protein QVD17_31117 [Tagetes erecta]